MPSNAVRAFISLVNNMQIAVLNVWCRVSSDHMCCKKKLTLVILIMRRPKVKAVKDTLLIISASVARKKVNI